MSICDHTCSCLCCHFMFSLCKLTSRAKRPIFYSLHSVDVKDHHLLLGPSKHFFSFVTAACVFSFGVTMPHGSVSPCSLRHCRCNLLHSLLSARQSHAQQGLLMPLHHPPTHPHSGGETVSAPSAHQIPAGPLWSTGGEFREQPLVVPTQRPSFTEGLIKPDNIPSALALLFSQLNAKWQLKASPRCRY